MRFRSSKILVVASILAACGCGSEPPPIVPDSALSRKALDAAMSAWKQGRPTGQIESTSPRIQVIDAHRVPGQTLERYEVLSDTASPRARTFSVRLHMKNPDERVMERFLVVGLDPVLIFRQKDFDLIMHWEHKMEPETLDPPEK